MCDREVGKEFSFHPRFSLIREGGQVLASILQLRQLRLRKLSDWADTTEIQSPGAQDSGVSIMLPPPDTCLVCAENFREILSDCP